MKALVLILVLALQGCMWQTVSSYDLYTAEQICGKDNIAEISVHAVGTESVTCKNSSKYILHDKRT